MLTHVMLVRLLMLSLVSASITHANATPTTIPLPIPHLTETTLFQVSQSVQGRPESLTCDLATIRALAQLHARIQRDHAARRVTSDELATAVPPKTLRTWDATRHQCRVTVRIEIPVLPRPTLRRPTTDITRGFVLHVGRPQTDTASPLMSSRDTPSHLVTRR